MELRVEDLRKSYGGTAVLQGVSFTAGIGLTRVTGSSGIGKTTLLRILLGLERADGGATNAGHFRWAAVFQEDRLLEQLDAAGNLRFALGAAYDETAARALLAELGLGEVGDKRVRDWSGGMKRRAGIAQAMLGEPKLIILDEPTVGLDPRQISGIRELIAKLGQSRTIILSSHILAEVSAVCDHVMIINRGNLVASDTLENIRRDNTPENRISMTVRANPDGIDSILRSIPGVIGYEISADPEGDNIYGVEIDTESNTDIREKLFFAFAQKNFAVRKLAKAELSLEEIFFRLTDASNVYDEEDGENGEEDEKAPHTPDDTDDGSGEDDGDDGEDDGDYVPLFGGRRDDDGEEEDDE